MVWFAVFINQISLDDFSSTLLAKKHFFRGMEIINNCWEYLWAWHFLSKESLNISIRIYVFQFVFMSVFNGFLLGMFELVRSVWSIIALINDFNELMQWTRWSIFEFLEFSELRAIGWFSEDRKVLCIYCSCWFVFR